jgi:hypothetical protein
MQVAIHTRRSTDHPKMSARGGFELSPLFEGSFLNKKEGKF